MITDGSLAILEAGRRRGRPRAAAPLSETVNTRLAAADFDRVSAAATARRVPISTLLREVILTSPALRGANFRKQ